MSTWFYTFQLSRIHCIQNRSKLPSDTDILSFGVVLHGRHAGPDQGHGRDQGHGSVVVPIFRDSTQNPDEINELAHTNGYGPTFIAEHMARNWMIGPTEVHDGEGIEIVVAATNTNDSELPTGDQQKIERMEL